MRSPSDLRTRVDRGSISAEFALALPAVIMVLLFVISMALQGAAQVSLEEGARAAARELARGEPAATAETAARRVAGEGTAVGISREGRYVTVTLTQPVRLLGWLEIEATLKSDATALVEDSR
ncbi:TadE family type IV pilus minor pilin [Nesterenkonia halotolerans]|uniref:Flp pilus assembly protein TadG n=1 Tax=Nesterenkonia halotolerans TaxID=225325 RepID=A0ABR9J8K9_9MICC|nr:TadE family type IV pilus minor pilin [Nesterenkonia halotolerans]MBE1515245.1 Flp pilus assembly protein TadG [Nesterenkonia halotolerans]